MPKDTIEKVAIITAAGSGMGAASARTLANSGYKVSLLSPSGRAESLAQELNGIGMTGSNQSVEDLQKLVEATINEWGRVDVLLNSAGHGPRGDILSLSDDDWHKGLDVYLMNVIRATRLVTPIMKQQGSGVILNISTFAAFEPDPTFPTSGVFRAGLASFTKLFADAHAKHNIRMNNILPGFIDSYPESPELIARIPMGRFGTTEEIAQTVAFLSSPGGTYITGQNIRVDGGITRYIS